MGIRVESLGFRVQGREFRASSAPPLLDPRRVQGLGFIVTPAKPLSIPQHAKAQCAGVTPARCAREIDNRLRTLIPAKMCERENVSQALTPAKVCV